MPRATGGRARATLGRRFGATDAPTFMGLPVWDVDPTKAVLIGADSGTPHSSVGFYRAGSPAAIRAASQPFGNSRHPMNIDIGAAALDLRGTADQGDRPVRPDDPSIMPAVIGRTAGGLSHGQALGLLAGVHRKARLAALGLVEFMPSRDAGSLGAMTAAPLLAAAIGLLSA